VSVIRYHETVWSDLFPGNRHTTHCLQPAVEAAEIALDLAAPQRRRTVWRIDAGGGSDDHLRWLLGRDYQVVAKGLNNRRALALARQVRRWDPAGEGSWLGEVPPPVDYGRPVRVFVKKRWKKDQFVHSYYVSSLALPSKRLFVAGYEDRGAAEVEQFRNDKGGLGLEARRKRSFLGQKGYILLTDLAHNLLADFYHRALVGSPFEAYGLKRMVRDLLAVPGRIEVGQDRVRVELLSQKQFSKDLVRCLERYCFGR
jgi:Transposase DDE domain group 1